MPWIAPIASALMMSLSPEPASAQAVSHTTIIRDYRVWGKNPGQIVSYMCRRPFRGDYGPAMANIRPKYNFSLKTKRDKAGCKLERVNLVIRFTMTLPKAVQGANQSRRTRNIFHQFRSFTKKHEETHRRIYISCARKMVSKIKRLPRYRTCSKIRQEIKQIRSREEAICERRHLAFDRRDFPKVRRLALFRKAYLPSGKASRKANPRINKKKVARATATWFSSTRISGANGKRRKP